MPRGVRLVRLALRTDRVDLESVSDGAPPELLANAISERSEFLALELDEPPSLHAHHVVARLLAVDELKVRLLGVEQRLHDDAGILQQMDGSVERCLRHAMTPPPQFKQKFFRLEDTVTSDDGIEHICAFVRVLQPSRFQIAAEHGAERRHRLLRNGRRVIA